MEYYDVDSKMWKSWASTTPQVTIKAYQFLYAESFGSKLFVGGTDSRSTHYLYCYDTEKNVWENIQHSLGNIGDICKVGDYIYVISSNFEFSQVSQRYNFVKRRWQRYAELNILKSDNYGNYFCNSGAIVFNSKVYVLYGSRQSMPNSSWCMKPAVLLSFDPVTNKWQQKASTRRPHFGSTLFVVNGRLYVAGGNVSISSSLSFTSGKPAPVEVYNENNNSWSVVKQQDHIPPNELGAVEVEGRVYFIINKFPIDSGIRIPPEEVYHVDLDDWENLRKFHSTSVLCYLPVKRENLKTAE